MYMQFNNMIQRECSICIILYDLTLYVGLNVKRVL